MENNYFLLHKIPIQQEWLFLFRMILYAKGIYEKNSLLGHNCLKLSLCSISALSTPNLDWLYLK